MFGAIIGDIIGSRYEGCINIPDDFIFMTEECRFTDDTVQTIAVAKAVKEHRETGASLKDLSVKYLQELGRRYLWCGCGDMFYKWLFKTDPQPYGSYGNGAIMRISPCAYYADSLKQALDYAEIVTSVTHNTDEAVRAAKSVTTAIWLARNGSKKNEILENLFETENFILEDVVPNKFDITCKGTLNIAVHAFMNGSTLEDVIRKAVVYGGDTDTNAAVAGSIASAYYGIPEYLKEIVYLKLDEYLLAMLRDLIA